MCQGCGQDWSRVRIIKLHACLRHGNDLATTTNIINTNKVTRDAVLTNVAVMGHFVGGFSRDVQPEM